MGPLSLKMKIAYFLEHDSKQLFFNNAFQNGTKTVRKKNNNKEKET